VILIAKIYSNLKLGEMTLREEFASEYGCEYYEDTKAMQAYIDFLENKITSRPDEVGVDYKYPIPYCPNCGMDGRMIYLHFKEHTNKEE